MKGFIDKTRYRVVALKGFQSLSIEGVLAMGKINGSRAAVRKQHKQKDGALKGVIDKTKCVW